MRNDYLYHHGIIGQKWGVRRYQNEDGTLTEAGKEHYGTLTREQQVGFNRLTREYNRANKQNAEFKNQYGYKNAKDAQRNINSQDAKYKKAALQYLENKENIEKIDKIISDPKKTEAYGTINVGKIKALQAVAAIGAASIVFGGTISRAKNIDENGGGATAQALGLGLSALEGLAVGVGAAYGVKRASQAIGNKSTRTALKNEKR